MGVEEREALYRRIIMEAYGLLWLTQTTDTRVHAARRRLLTCLNKDEQMAGIAFARSSPTAREGQ